MVTTDRHTIFITCDKHHQSPILILFSTSSFTRVPSRNVLVTKLVSTFLLSSSALQVQWIFLAKASGMSAGTDKRSKKKKKLNKILHKLHTTRLLVSHPPLALSPTDFFLKPLCILSVLLLANLAKLSAYFLRQIYRFSGSSSPWAHNRHQFSHSQEIEETNN